MRRSFRLTAAAPSQSINVDFQASTIVVDNPTGSPVFLRTGAPDIPHQRNADLVIPAASSSSHATSGRDFGAALGDPTLIASASSALSGLFDVVIVTLLDESELVPSYGAFSFLSLSLTDLYPLATFTAAYIGPFDLGPWGGVHVLVLPSAASGQGMCQIEVKQTSPDVGTGWTIYGQWAFWAGLPLSLTVPRTTRYVRVLLNHAAVPGDPVIGGTVAVRASLAEVAQLAATPATTSLSRGVSVPNLGSQSFVYATFGLRSVTLRLNVTVGVGGEMILYTSSGATGPWALVTFREQNIQGFYNSIARTVGQLDAYLRVDVLDISGGGVQGTLSASIQESPDLTAYLQNIYSALGDTGQPVNVGQSIYHALKNISTYTDGLEGLVTSTNTKLDTLNTKLDTLNTNTDGLEGLVTSTNTKLDTILSNMQRTTNSLGLNFTISVANVWQNIGAFLTPGSYIRAVQISYQMGSPITGGFTLNLGSGPAGAVSSAWFGQGGALPEGIGPWGALDSPSTGGFLLPANHTNVWALCTVAGTTVQSNIVTRAP